MSDSADDIQKHVKKYLFIGGVLVVFTVITVMLSFVDFGGHSNNMIIGLAVAAFKASLVGLIFMHLNHERSLIYKFLSFTAVFIIVMFVLFLAAHADPLVFHHFEANPEANVH